MTRIGAAGWALASLSLVAACAAFVAGAHAVPPQSGAIDLLIDRKVLIDGAGGLTGDAVSNAGDVNGDGRADVIIGAPQLSLNGRYSSGAAYVVFGGLPSSGSIDLEASGAPGFRIDGATGGTMPTPLGELAGSSVSGAGDVNGDGLADVIVGAPEADHNGRINSGSAYVVFGRTATTPVDLASLGAGGFRIDGATGVALPELGDSAGRSVAGLGDVNGDDLDDVIVGAATTDQSGSDAGTAYVVFGKTSSTTVDLGALGSGGYRIDGATSNHTAGWSSSSVADMNGDGVREVLLGAPGFNGHRGAAYVVYGKATTTTVDLGSLGTGGFRIEGVVALDRVGEDVSDAGDVNGDGLPDVIVGAPEADNRGRDRSGSAYVVFGKASTAPVSLATLGSGGYRIDGAAVEDIAGTAVSGAGDLNGDGRSDVVVGAPFSDNNGRSWSGSAYVVFGKTSSDGIDLAALGTSGYRLDGAALADSLGEAVAGVGDITGDGSPDVLVGAPWATPPNGFDEGAVHIFDFGDPRLVYLPLLRTVGVATGAHVPADFERTGAGTIQVVPPLPAGLAIDASGRITGTATALHPTTTHTVTLEDLKGTVATPLAITVVAPPPGPPPVDSTAPRLTLRAGSPQRALRQKRIVVRARCNEPCSLRAQGSIAILGSRVRIPLRAASASRAATAQRMLGLGLTKASLRRLSAELAKGRRARATVTVTARDRAGNARAATRSIAVRR